MRTTATGVLLSAAVALLAVPEPLQAAAAEAQLLVTARVVNRCTIDVPARPPGLGGEQPWRRWVHHACDLPVQPRLSLGRAAGPPDAPGPGVDRARRGGHMVVTITY